MSPEPLRHTHTTLLLANGGHSKVVQERHGHLRATTEGSSSLSHQWDFAQTPRTVPTTTLVIEAAAFRALDSAA